MLTQANSELASKENATQTTCLLVMLVYRQTLSLYDLFAGTFPMTTKLTNNFEQFDLNNPNSGGANMQKWEGGALQY